LQFNFSVYISSEETTAKYNGLPNSDSANAVRHTFSSKVSVLLGKEKVCYSMTLANSSAFSQEKLDRIFNFLTTILLSKAGIACSIASKVLISMLCLCHPLSYYFLGKIMRQDNQYL